MYREREREREREKERDYVYICLIWTNVCIHNFTQTGLLFFFGKDTIQHMVTESIAADDVLPDTNTCTFLYEIYRVCNKSLATCMSYFSFFRLIMCILEEGTQHKVK